MSRTESADARVVATESPTLGGRLGPLFAGIWLFFLLNPLLEGWAHRDELRGVLGMLFTVAFAAVYMLLWVRARAVRGRLVTNPPLSWSLPYIGSLAVLGALTVWCVGEPGLACVVYVSVACVMVFSFRVAALIAIVLVLGTIALGAREEWGSQVGTAFAIMAASLAVFGMRAVMNRNIDLINAQIENARLAVDNERSRFARDLHDILGHSLTVITVKAELAQKLLDVDLDRARTEIADLERLSRDALTDVRRAVEGYREITLPGELVRARVALRAAEIDADLPNSTDDVPSELRELFAWTVREGVTNVIRHSGAAHCEVRLTPTSAEVRDDGTTAPSPTGHGSGLAGLRERAADVGATVITTELAPGFSLRVVRP
ncbi:MAG TPA: sensor histidine kinase [Nocardioides sp.]|uniref:sensor histidine kinase n=1 Tax=uncultured Nocardioides sp. TaxID=198441 RepID=UPI002616BF79|nr:sensor histidine kinase [uncultured Nocardioides sp.]HRI94596.1 sensor histidine kinase [Nocardioides sp.]